MKSNIYKVLKTFFIDAEAGELTKPLERRQQVVDRFSDRYQECSKSYSKRKAVVKQTKQGIMILIRRKRRGRHYVIRFTSTK